MIESGSIRLEAAMVCQVRRFLCFTTQGAIGKQLKPGFLRNENFQKLLNENPWVHDIELSSWGEIFLNPHLLNIVRLAHQRRARLRAANGVNLNTVSHARQNIRDLRCIADAGFNGELPLDSVAGLYFFWPLLGWKRWSSFAKSWNDKRG